MGKEVLIHVGMPKTATTFFQKELFNSIGDTFFFQRDHDLWDLIFYLPFSHQAFDNIDHFKKRANEAMDRIREKHVIISHESLFGHPWFNFENHERDAAILKELFPDAKILVTIRRQDDFLESLYRHAIQVGFSQKLHTFLNYSQGRFGKWRYNTGLNIDVRRLNYAYLVGVYQELFGKERVKVIPYELFRSDDKKFLKEIFDFSGLPEVYPERTTKKVNRGLKKSTSRLMRFLNPLFKHSQSNGLGIFPQKPLAQNFRNLAHTQHRYWIFLFRLSRSMTLLNFLRFWDRIIGVKGKWLNAELRREIMEFHHDSNQRLQEESGVELQKFGYFGEKASSGNQ